MIKFSHRDEKITKLFDIIFWILVGFHIVFGCIAHLIHIAIIQLSKYQIADIRLYVMALRQWVVS